MANSFNGELAELQWEHRTLEADRVYLIKHPENHDAYTAHLAKLNAHSERLRDYLRRLQADQIRQGRPDR